MRSSTDPSDVESYVSKAQPRLTRESMVRPDIFHNQTQTFYRESTSTEKPPKKLGRKQRAIRLRRQRQGNEFALRHFNKPLEPPKTMKNEEFNFTERARAITPRPDSSRPPSKSYKASRGDRAADSRPCPPQFPNGKGTARTGASSSGPPHTYDNPDGQTGHSLVPGHYPGEGYYYSPPIYNGCKFPTPYSTAESGALQVPRLTSSYDSQYGMSNSFGTPGTEMVGVVPSTGPQFMPMPAMLAPRIASPWMICQFCLCRPVVFATYPDQRRNLSPN